MASVHEMIDQVMAMMDGRPAFEVMRTDEVERGNQVVMPGSVPWLSLADWDSTSVVSRAGKEVRLIAILSVAPAGGTLRRTVAGILSEGLVPVIIAPTNGMRNTLKRWGWFPRHIGSGWDHEEQWRPRKGWTA